MLSSLASLNPFRGRAPALPDETVQLTPYKRHEPPVYVDSDEEPAGTAPPILAARDAAHAPLKPKPKAKPEVAPKEEVKKRTHNWDCAQVYPKETEHLFGALKEYPQLAEKIVSGRDAGNRWGTKTTQEFNELAKRLKRTHGALWIRDGPACKERLLALRERYKELKDGSGDQTVLDSRNCIACHLQVLCVEVLSHLREQLPAPGEIMPRVRQAPRVPCARTATSGRVRALANKPVWGGVSDVICLWQRTRSVGFGLPPGHDRGAIGLELFALDEVVQNTAGENPKGSLFRGTVEFLEVPAQDEEMAWDRVRAMLLNEGNEGARMVGREAPETSLESRKGILDDHASSIDACWRAPPQQRAWSCRGR